jgi:hypothetical protein
MTSIPLMIEPPAERRMLIQSSCANSLLPTLALHFLSGTPSYSGLPMQPVWRISLSISIICQKSHELLLFLLNTFHDNLKGMVQHSCSTGHYRPPPPEFDFATAATVVCWVRHALMLLTMGAAL